MTAELYQTLLSRGAWVNLSSRAKWRLSGADRVRYLNGQVTNDIRMARKDSALHACVTNLKGKIEADIHIHVAPDGESLLFDAPADLRESLGMRLERYIIADDAILEDVTDEWQLWHWISPENVAPPLADEAVKNTHRFQLGGTDHWIPRESAPPQGLILSEAEAESLRILQGVPAWPQELNPETFPQEANLENTAMSFSKGCYVGQEILSRIKTSGKMPRQLVTWTSAACPAPNEELFTAEDQAIGQVTCRTQHPVTQEFVGLAYVKLSAASAPTWKTASGVTVTRSER